MGQSSNYAAVKVVTTKLSKEECAAGTEQSSNDAAVKDAQNMLRKEECVLGMGQTSHINDVVMKDVRNKFKGEECAEGMGRIALPTMYPLLLEQNSSTRLWHLSVYPIIAMLLRRNTKEVLVYLRKYLSKKLLKCNAIRSR